MSYPAPATWEQPLDELPKEALQAAATMDPQVYIKGFAPPSIEVVVREEPKWLGQYAARLDELIKAGAGAPDWNGHGAKPLQREALKLGLQVLDSLHKGGEDRPFPWIVPTSRGGLQYEWHEDGADLEIDIDPNGSIDVIFTDRQQQKEWDGTLTERMEDVLDHLDRLENIKRLASDMPGGE